MAIYYINYLLTLLWRMVFPGNKNKRVYLFVVCFQLFLILSLRSGDMTADEWQYYDVFNSVRDFSFTELLSRWSFLKQMNTGSYTEESGFTTIAWIFSHVLGTSFNAYIAFLALIQTYCMYKFLNHFSEAPLLGALTFQSSLFFSYIQLLKRTLSGSFVFLAYCELSKRNYKKAFFILLIASTMHRTALLFFIFLPLSKLNMRKLTLLSTFYFMLLALALIPFAMPVFSSIITLMNKASVLNSEITMPAAMKMALSSLFIFFLYLFVDEKTLSSPDNNVLCWILCFYVCFIPAEQQLHILSAITMYFTPPMAVLISNVVSKRKDKHTRIFLWIIVFLFIMYLFLRTTENIRLSSGTIGGGISGYKEYRTIWSK